jgi:hypothetical protein
VILPPPITSDCTLDDVEEYLDRKAGRDLPRLTEETMPNPTGDDWLSQDDPPPKPPPKTSK